MIGRPRRISELLGGEHRDLDEIWERLTETPATDPLARRTLFNSFRDGLLEHIAIEEERLFPWMQEGDPSRRQLVDRLLEEHRRIREHLDRVDRQLGASSASFEAAGLELVNELWEHNAREEAMVYPWLDDHLSPDQLLEVRDRRAAHGRR